MTLKRITRSLTKMSKKLDDLAKVRRREIDQLEADKRRIDAYIFDKDKEMHQARMAARNLNNILGINSEALTEEPA